MLTVNGGAQELEIDSAANLFWGFREHFALTGMGDGCEDEAERHGELPHANHEVRYE